MALRLLMMGTGGFALPTFRALLDSPHDVAGLVTQPDRTGRGHHHHTNVMKEAAEAAGVGVFQPAKANAEDSLDRLREFAADLFVVAAYGQILSADLLAIPPRGAINVHASLLPKYRGAAPIQYAILHGETRTGVSIFQIEPKLDAGPILGVVETEIGPEETSGELEARLADLAAPLTVQVVNDLERGTAQGILQDADQVTLAPRMAKTMGEIDWSRTSHEIACHVRAMQPWPMPYTFLHRGGAAPQRLLVLETADVEGRPAGGDNLEPGDAIGLDEARLIVRTGDGFVEITRIQPAGKRAMSAADFLRGRPLSEGDRFGGET
ncbi:MAG: methionyl-tRNA formyltransferase [Planctomycetota bacterium]|nr:MAG: methionyl-tRNA formyltransferase [Planctomycetota bacterium]REJ94302.1 MAG: methionyl-tRNA formyltransferase [Planctomycetota bacterium]REK23169.1 MAG: methionyl-tRNA formyltransferase [Planctomycetota bacterium]REK30916.1 MAG: methionyl-tRNA formyltransferase [Planctomycetota bacterium]